MDIILLIVLCSRIRNIVKLKGYNGTSWFLRTLLICFSGEIFGFGISYYLEKDLIVCMVSGLLCIVACFLFMQNRARKLPDLNKKRDWKDHLNQD